MDDMPIDPAAASATLLNDLTPGSITAAPMDGGEPEQFETIGDLLQHLLDLYRVSERGSVTHGDFLAGYSDDGSAPQRMPTASDSAVARRA